VKKALLIDGHSLAYRAFFAVAGLTTKDGQPTNALLGFANMVLQIIKNRNPDQVYVAFDLPKPTFRHKLYPEYKGHRETPPDEFISQIPLIKEFVEAIGLPIVQQEGFEADDVIGALANKLSSEGVQPFIVTGDKDAFQLVTEDIRVLLTKKGITEIEEYGPAEVYDRYGLLVDQIIDMKALMGDSSDNIPGVKGVGEKTAIKLLIDYGTLEDLYENVGEIKGKLQEKLINDKDNAFLSKKLATIDTTVALQVSLQDIDIDLKLLEDFLKKYQLYSLIKCFIGAEQAVEEKQVETAIIDNKESLAEAIAYIKKQKEISVYCEYDDRTGDIIGLSIAFGAGNAYVIPLSFLSGNLSSGEQSAFGPMFATEEDSAFEDLKEIFNQNNHKVLHDAKRLKHTLDNEGIELNGTYDDVMLMDYLLTPDRNNREIDKMMNVYLHENVLSKKEVLSKSKKYHFCEIAADKALDYMAKRAEAILRLKPRLLSLLETEGVLFIYEEMDLPLINVLFKMEQQGILIDKKYLKDMSKHLHTELTSIEDNIYILAGEEFNINSTKQLQVILYEKLGLPALKKTKTGYSTNVDVLEDLAGKYEIAKSLIEYRKLAKLLNTYVDALPKLADKDGRIHTTFNPTVAATGRLSSSEPNLQNIPIRGDIGSKIRGAFVAKPGYTLIVADYSQIELRILAHISKDEKLSEAFLTGKDVHSATAASVFDVPLEEVTTELRRKAKAINFGLAYGMGAFNMANSLGVEMHEAQHHIDVYFNNFPNIQKFMEEAPKKVMENGYIETLYGRKRYFKDFATAGKREQNSQARMIINSPIQGLAADIVKLAMIELDKEIAAYDANVLLQVHDELVVEVKNEQADELCKLVVDIMENAYKIDVPLLVNASVGDNWLEAK